MPRAWRTWAISWSDGGDWRCLRTSSSTRAANSGSERPAGVRTGPGVGGVFSGFLRAAGGLARRGPAAALGREEGRRDLASGRRRDLGMSGRSIFLLGSRCKMIAGVGPRSFFSALRPVMEAGIKCQGACSGVMDQIRGHRRAGRIGPRVIPTLAAGQAGGVAHPEFAPAGVGPRLGGGRADDVARLPRRVGA